jgi:hypothetical protein
MGIPHGLTDEQEDSAPVDIGSIEAESAEVAMAAYSAMLGAECEDDPDGAPPPVITGAVAFSTAELEQIRQQNASAGAQRAVMADCTARGVSYWSGERLAGLGGDSAGYLDEE